MDKTNNLQHFLTDIADAIREKKGTSDLINAQSFADEIKNISQSGEGGNTNYKYYLIDPTSMNYLVCVYSSLIKYKSKRNGEICITSTPYAHQNQEQDLLSCRVNLNDRMYERSWTTIFDVVNQIESNYGKLTEITEEEFYNLNA